MDLVQSKSLVQARSAPSKRLSREALIGLLFLSPWLIGFILLKALPILVAFGFSLTNFKMLSPETTQFVGLANYVRLFKDNVAGASLFGSLSYFILTVPVEMGVALILAAICTSERLKNKRWYRTLIFMTSVIPATSIFFIFLGFMQYLDRLVLKPNGLPPLNEFEILGPFLALWSIGPGFLIILSAMEGIPRELYEAARVDGAGPLARFIYVTVPMVSPAVFFTLVINLTGAFGGAVLLDRGYVMNFSLSPMESYINQTMFSRSELGYASTLAWATFVVMMALTVILFRSSRRWVYFPEEDENAEI
jgi:ABC-type sugar transport system permease subunit